MSGRSWPVEANVCIDVPLGSLLSVLTRKQSHMTARLPACLPDLGRMWPLPPSWLGGCGWAPSGSLWTPGWMVREKRPASCSWHPYTSATGCSKTRTAPQPKHRNAQHYCPLLLWPWKNYCHEISRLLSICLLCISFISLGPISDRLYDTLSL